MHPTIARSLFALALFATSMLAQTGGSSAPQPATECQARQLTPISPKAEQIASAIGILASVQRVRALASGCNPPGSISIEELALRQQVMESVLTASLDVGGVLAEIDEERAQILDVRAQLSSRRDHRMNLLSLANIAASAGSGVIGTALQFNDRTALAGDGVGVGGGAAGVLLSVLGLRQKGGKRPLGIAPNMLAPLFGRRPELRSVYPQDVWTYLNAAPAADPRIYMPWREQLIKEWVQAGRIGPPDAPGSQEKIDLLTSRIGEQKRLSIDVLTDRSAMLLELRARVSLMNGDLRDVMEAVSLRPVH